MTGMRCALRVLAALACVVGLSAATVRADAVTVGGLGNGVGDAVILSYDANAPLVEIGSSGSYVPMEYDPDQGVLAKVFQITNPGYHHLHIVEYVVIVGDSSIDDWYEVLMVPDGEGGWNPSGNYDDLWYSCYYTGSYGPITPDPVVTPDPLDILVTNKPTDLLSITWDESLAVGTLVTVDRWVTVPATVTEFALFHFTLAESPAVPEPATMGLLGIGLGVLVLRKQKD